MDSIDYDQYMERILSTTTDNSKNQKYQCVYKKQKSISALKEEVYDLADVEEILEKFTETYKPGLKHLSDVFERLSFSEKKHINKLLGELKFLITEIRIKHLINENIISLACYLARLKVTTLTNDTYTGNRIINKFIKDKDLNLNSIFAEIEDFKKKLELLEKVYLRFIDFANGASFGLEHRFSFNHNGVHDIENLKNLTLKQEELLHHIGCNFVSVSRKVLSDKEHRKILKKTGFFK